MIFLILLVSIAAGRLMAEQWEEEKSTHFIIYYPPGTSLEWISRVKREAENNYSSISDLIGHTRYKNYWTWDDRVEIYIFPDKESFIQATGQPDWSYGVATTHGRDISSRTIKSYFQSERLFEDVLPHEISHFILRDFLGGGMGHVPLWFDEGIAQLNESNKKFIAHQVMKQLIKKGQYLPLGGLMHYNVRSETDAQKVSAYYAQSVSIVDFLISKYGSDRFKKLCSQLKSGKDFANALQGAYTEIFDSVDELENKWVQYLIN